MYHLKDYSCRNIKCKNSEFFKKTKKYENENIFFIYKIQTIKTGIHTKVKCIVADYVLAKIKFPVYQFWFII